MRTPRPAWRAPNKVLCWDTRRYYYVLTNYQGVEMSNNAFASDFPGTLERRWIARMMSALFFGLFYLAAASGAWAQSPKVVESTQSRQVVDGVIINVGWISAVDAAKFEAEKNLHQSHLHKKGVYHLVVTLSDARSGKPIKNATVAAVIDDPFDRIQRKLLKKSEINGFTDYSDYYEFSGVGRYFLNLEIILEGRAAPLKARFQRDYDGSK